MSLLSLLLLLPSHVYVSRSLLEEIEELVKLSNLELNPCHSHRGDSVRFLFNSLTYT